MCEKIDFIITWVDGTDPEWKKVMNQYAKNSIGDKRKIRFRDWENLHYWFRGIEKFTPWVNKIHFVTWGHLPHWLRIDHPKLNIVNHKDYIPDEYLPTFNSHVIELNFHRIEGLSNHFVYFNDDTFVIDNMGKKDFFKKGLPCDVGIIMPCISTFRNSTACIVSNNMEIINTVFDKNTVIKKNILKWFNPIYGKYLISTFCSMPYKHFAGFFNPHLPNSFLKETFYELWQLESEVLHKTCLHKFRNGRDVNQWLMRYWQLAKGKFHPRRISIGRVFSLTNNNDNIISAIRNQQYKMICINDNDKEPIKDFNREKELLKQAFEYILPESRPSNCEVSDYA